jgi:chemotaxis protein methyltransferase CheR
MAIIENTTREFVFTEKDFNRLRKIANAHTGIVVSDDKYDMYYSRLVKRLRKLGLGSFAEYVDYLEQNEATEFTPFIDSITTNLTSFFRENHHFEILQNRIIPELVEDAGCREIRVWSAGCSTGEEPYSIAITLKEALASYPAVKARIVASDIDTTVLAKAASGIYEDNRVSTVKTPLLKRWFMRGKGSNEGMVRVSHELRNMIEFKQVNLMKDWPIKDKFHIIFCRNVVIYFDRPTKTKLLDRYAEQLVDRGHLILGHSESLHGLTNRFDTIGKTVYKKKF